MQNFVWNTNLLRVFICCNVSVSTIAIFKRGGQITQSQDSITHQLKGIVYKGLDEFHRKSKLHRGQHAIGRMLSLCSVKPRKKVLSQTYASNQLAR